MNIKEKQDILKGAWYIEADRNEMNVSVCILPRCDAKLVLWETLTEECFAVGKT